MLTDSQFSSCEPKKTDKQVLAVSEILDQNLINVNAVTMCEKQSPIGAILHFRTIVRKSGAQHNTCVLTDLHAARCRSQIFTVLSPLPVTTCFKLHLNLAAVTLREWPVSVNYESRRETWNYKQSYCKP